jgi:hypothetical protein
VLRADDDFIAPYLPIMLVAVVTSWLFDIRGNSSERGHELS